MHPRLQNIPLSELLSHIIDNILDRYEQIDRRWIRLEQCLGKRFRVTTLHEKENKLMEYSIYKLQYHLWELDREEENLTKSEIKLLCNECFHQRPMIGRPHYPLPSYNEYFGYHNNEEGIAHTYDENGYNCKEENYSLPSYDEYYGYSKKEENCIDQETYEEPTKRIEPEMEEVKTEIKEVKAEIVQDPEAALLVEKKRKKLFVKCLERYYVYNLRCIEMEEYLGYSISKRKSQKKLQYELEKYSYEELKNYRKKLRERALEVYQLEQLHFPHVMFFYFQEDYFEKKLKKFWNRAKGTFEDTKKKIYRPIKLLSSKITNHQVVRKISH